MCPERYLFSPPTTTLVAYKKAPDKKRVYT